MKRVTIRPGRVVTVSDEAIARAKMALAAFGVTDRQLVRSANSFVGDAILGRPLNTHGVKLKKHASTAKRTGKITAR